MGNVIQYKDYYANVEYNSDDDVFVGKVQGIADVLVFEGYSVSELKQAFQETIDGYLDLCNRIGKDPNKPFKGSFNIRISSDMHKEASRQAAMLGITLNEFVSRAIDEKIQHQPERNLNIVIQVADRPVPALTNMMDWNTSWKVPTEDIMPKNRIREFLGN